MRPLRPACNAAIVAAMVPFFELHDPSVAGGAVSSGPSSRVLVVDGSPELERWLLGLAVPPPGVLFLHRRDLANARDARFSCAVGASFLPSLEDVTLRDWVFRASETAERRGFHRDDADALLENLGLRFLGRTPLAHLPPALRPRASLAAALASNRPVLVADATTGFGTLDRDPQEYAAWDRLCAGRDVVLLLPRHAALAPFRERRWVIVNEAPSHAEAAQVLRVRASVGARELASALDAEGFAVFLEDGEVLVARGAAEDRTVARLAAALVARGWRLREATPVAAARPAPATPKRDDATDDQVRPPEDVSPRVP